MNVKKEEDEYKSRGNWSSNIDAIISYIGVSVGLGNIWRFPHLAYKNGGASFLVPYFIMMVFIGIPMFFMELALGQFSSKGASGVWDLSPFFRGIGYSATSICAIVSVYYNMIIAFVIYFLFASVTTKLPWATCNNSWNTDKCQQTSFIHGNISERSNISVINGTIYNTTHLVTNGNISEKATLPAEEYWLRHVLQLSDGINDLGQLRWQLVLPLLFAWLLVFFCIIKGIKSSGKVMYFTAVFPYVMLTAMFIRGLTLPGSKEGILFFLVPDWPKIKDVLVWGDAATQLFYSLGPGWGMLISYASYSKFHVNSHRDSIIVTLLCCSTSIYAGLVVFSVVGSMAHELNLPVEEVIRPGPGLVFIVYPEALARFPAAPFWAIAFFIMLLCVSLDSQFAQVQVIVTAICDEFPETFHKRKVYLTATVCIVLFLLGLPQATNAGMYIITLLDWAIGSFPLLVVGLLETLVVAHIYGFQRFSLDIQSMVGFKPNLFWIACWTCITPCLVLFVLIFVIITYQPVSLEAYSFPVQYQAIGWCIWVLVMAWLPFWMLIQIYKTSKITFGRRCSKYFWQKLVEPSADWHPSLTEHCLERERIENEAKNPYEEDFEVMVELQRFNGSI